MPARCASFFRSVLVPGFAAALLAATLSAQEAPNPGTEGPMVHPPDTHPAPQVREPVPARTSSQTSSQGQPVPPPPPAAQFDPALFQKPIAPAEIAPLAQFAGAQAKDLFRDKLFRRALRSIEPDCMFHYGKDMSLSEAMEIVFSGSRYAVQLREGRYLSASGDSGPYLRGRGFIWIDLKSGIGAGAFFFTPTNGEPTPALNVFSRQVRDEPLSMGAMPPAFAEDLSQWALTDGVPMITSRYFLTGANRKVLLEHDENFCISSDGIPLPPESGCEQMMADAADLDLTAAYYVDETGHRTNATAWMMSPDQVEFLSIRDRSCRTGPDPLGCRIRLTRERTRTVVRGRPRRL